MPDQPTATPRYQFVNHRGQARAWLYPDGRLEILEGQDRRIAFDHWNEYLLTFGESDPTEKPVSSDRMLSVLAQALGCLPMLEGERLPGNSSADRNRSPRLLARSLQVHLEAVRQTISNHLRDLDRYGSVDRARFERAHTAVGDALDALQECTQ